MFEYRPIIINGEETNYEISNTGDLRNSKTGNSIKPRKERDYLRVGIYHKGKKYRKSIHRLVAEAFIPNPENLPQVNHINCVKIDNMIENLEWCTAQENTQHAHDNGLCRDQYGEENPSNKYSENTVRQVCDLLEKATYSYSEISEITGVSKSTVKHILDGSEWTKVTQEYNFEKILKLPKHRKRPDYSSYFNSIDRAIVFGKDKQEVIDTIREHGLNKRAAYELYMKRKKKVDSHESIVQYSVYIDEGVEIFK